MDIRKLLERRKKFEQDWVNKIHHGNAFELAKSLPAGSINCIVTSPPYWQQRDYNNTEEEFGSEPTIHYYIENLVLLFRRLRRALRHNGTFWLNLGDAYATGEIAEGIKAKDLIGLPWQVAFALRRDGWWLRSDVIWCLSGGTWVYTRTQKGDMPMMVRNMARLDPATVKLWNGRKWTNLLGMNKNKRHGDELEIVLRSGERISCTPTHRFPTTRGLIDTIDLNVGDILTSCQLPEPDSPRDCAIDDDAAWFAGLYIAEGSMSDGTIQISGHSKERKRWVRVKRIAEKFGGSATMTEDGNNQLIRVYGKVLNALLCELVTGKTSHDKGFATVVWRYSNRFIASMVDGYLSGDGHLDGNRWRLRFCRNYNLERDLRTACARLGYTLTLNLASAEYNGKQFPAFRGELRKIRSGHHNEKDRNEIIEIRKARCREVYDIGVENDPHLFALASGILTHNSKPSPMAEPVQDRPTKSHEYFFLFTKNPTYYYDLEAIREPVKPGATGEMSAPKMGSFRPKEGARRQNKKQYRIIKGANRKSVWFISQQQTKGIPHTATFPEEVVEPCILAGCPKKGIVLDPFIGSGTTAVVAKRLGRKYIGFELNAEYVEYARKRVSND